MAISNASSGFRPGVCTFTTRPTSPFNGQVIYETDTKQTLVWQGSAWVMLTDADTPPALELVKVQTIGSNVNNITVTNAFSSIYTDYKIVLYSALPSSDNQMTFYFSGSSTGYYQMLNYGTWAGSGPSFASQNNATQWSWIGGSKGSGTASLQYAEINLSGPFEAYNTFMFSPAYGGIGLGGHTSGVHNVAMSHTGFVLTVGNGTISGGTIRVYGYRNAI